MPNGTPKENLLSPETERHFDSLKMDLTDYTEQAKNTADLAEELVVLTEHMFDKSDAG